MFTQACMNTCNVLEFRDIFVSIKYNILLTKLILWLNPKSAGSGAMSNSRGLLSFDLDDRPIARWGDEINRGLNSPPLVSGRYSVCPRTQGVFNEKEQ
jgi:hypothetical protein